MIVGNGRCRTRDMNAQVNLIMRIGKVYVPLTIAVIIIVPLLYEWHVFFMKVLPSYPPLLPSRFGEVGFMMEKFASFLANLAKVFCSLSIIHSSASIWKPVKFSFGDLHSIKF
uniref:Uncharacterized protein n=1 Tax=Opuntia streptacantha TaxID=393608 RepID=A0A7C9E334_OPUST